MSGGLRSVYGSSPRAVVVAKPPEGVVYGSSHWAFTPRAVVVAKPPEGVVFASFRADVFFNPGTPIPLCISGSLFGVFRGFEGVALGHHWDVIWRALRANLRSIKDFNSNPKYYGQ